MVSSERRNLNYSVGVEYGASEPSMRRGQTFSSEWWQAEVAARLGLESLLRPRG
jgi:hypothetical protein